MQDTTHSLRPLWDEIRAEFRRRRQARAARRALERDLASYTSASDLNDLDAILERHTEDESAEIRRILVGRRGI